MRFRSLLENKATYAQMWDRMKKRGAPPNEEIQQSLSDEISIKTLTAQKLYLQSGKVAGQQANSKVAATPFLAIRKNTSREN